jgi:hypothetical protein
MRQNRCARWEVQDLLICIRARIHARHKAQKSTRLQAGIRGAHDAKKGKDAGTLKVTQIRPIGSVSGRAFMRAVTISIKNAPLGAA